MQRLLSPLVVPDLVDRSLPISGAPIRHVPLAAVVGAVVVALARGLLVNDAGPLLQVVNVEVLLRGADDLDYVPEVLVFACPAGVGGALKRIRISSARES